MEQLTDKAFWEKYWLAKKDLFQPISRKYVFSDIFENIVLENKPKSAIEIGGFPGFHSVFLHKYFNISVTLLDIVIVPTIIEKICRINELDPSKLVYIEADFFTYTPTQKFDLVFSNGFIEHFTDTEKVIQQHLEYLNTKGTLLITLPNFKGINGWFQKIFDKDNYNKHNIQCMDRAFLRSICEKLKLTNIEVYYYGYFSIWLEEKARKKLLPRICRALIFYPFKILFRILRWNTKYFAPYLVVKASMN